MDFLPIPGTQQTNVGLRLCKRPGCGEWFWYGGGTGRRKTAIFCTPKCQKAYYYGVRAGRY